MYFFLFFLLIESLRVSPYDAYSIESYVFSSFWLLSNKFPSILNSHFNETSSNYYYDYYVYISYSVLDFSVSCSYIFYSSINLGVSIDKTLVLLGIYSILVSIL